MTVLASRALVLLGLGLLRLLGLGLLGLLGLGLLGLELLLELELNYFDSLP